MQSLLWRCHNKPIGISAVKAWNTDLIDILFVISRLISTILESKNLEQYEEKP